MGALSLTLSIYLHHHHVIASLYHHCIIIEKQIPIYSYKQILLSCNIAIPKLLRFGLFNAKGIQRYSKYTKFLLINFQKQSPGGVLWNMYPKKLLKVRIKSLFWSSLFVHALTLQQTQKRVQYTYFPRIFLIFFKADIL